VLTWRTSQVVNFAHGAMGMYVAFAYYEFRDSGELVLPILGLPDRVALLPAPTLATALVFALVLAAALGLAVYWLVFRPLRSAPPLAQRGAAITGTGSASGSAATGTIRRGTASSAMPAFCAAAVSASRPSAGCGTPWTSHTSSRLSCGLRDSPGAG